MPQHASGFHFGLEAEFLLVEAASFRPLWPPQLRFDELHAIFEWMAVDDLDSRGLDLRPLHRKPMPFVIEGYQIPDRHMEPAGLLAKGLEIRPPICGAIEQCLKAFVILHKRLQRALRAHGYVAVALSFHPTEDHFEGPQNKK